MRPVIGAFLVKEFRVAFPIEPAFVERPVGETHETVFARAASGPEHVAHGSRVVARRRLHYARVTPAHFFMAHPRIEVVAEPRLEPV